MMKYKWKIQGHTSIVSFLQTAIEKQRYAHAYLFVGVQSIGKTNVAQNFTKSIMCHSDIITPCNKCSNCIQIEKKIHPDYIEANTNDTQKISIKIIRNYIKRLNIQSTSKHKIFIISNAHKLSIQASNALLKTLEEPNKNTIIILITHKESLLPQTILSRCSILRFSALTTSNITNILMNQKSIPQETAKQVASIAHGKIEYAILLSQETELEKYKENFNFFITLHQSPIIDKIKLLQDNIFKIKDKNEQKQNIRKVLEIWQNIYRDLMLQKLGLATIVTNTHNSDKLHKIASNKEWKEIHNGLNNIDETLRIFNNTNVNHKLLLENLVLVL